MDRVKQTYLYIQYLDCSDASADLDYVATSSLALNGGKIVDVSNNAANLTLASPGSTGSLGAVPAILVDTTAPNVVISAISYDSSNNVIYIDGTGMDDVVSFDWTKLKLDINSDDSSTADHTFSSNDIDSVLSIGAKSIAIKLVDDNVSTTGANKIEGMSGYGVAGGKDSFEISSGFLLDNPGNVSTSTADVRWKIPTITAANYTATTNTLTLKGQDLDLLVDNNVTNANWDKFTWEVDGSSAQKLASSDIVSITKSSSLAIDVAINSTASLLSITGFLGGTPDTFTIADGFITASDSASLPTGVAVLADAAGPTITSVSLQGLSDGDLISPDKSATILINLNEDVAAGTAITGQMNVTTSAVSSAPYPIVFKALDDGTVLTGTFTPATNDNESTAIDIKDLSLKNPLVRD